MSVAEGIEKYGGGPRKSRAHRPISGMVVPALPDASEELEVPALQDTLEEHGTLQNAPSSESEVSDSIQPNMSNTWRSARHAEAE